MSDEHKESNTCPSCGYPEEAGHAWNCELDKKKREYESPYTHDYSSVEPEMERFIIPHAAKGQNTHSLTIKESDFEMPVSFHVEGENFYITGLRNEGDVGAIIWGNISKDLVKIKHIELAKYLRGKGVGKALLADLEQQLAQQGVTTAYSAFANPDTVEFFLKKGYNIIPLKSLSEEQRTRLDMDTEDYDDRIMDEDSFNSLKRNEQVELKKILLHKEIKHTEGQ